MKPLYIFAVLVFSLACYVPFQAQAGAITHNDIIYKNGLYTSYTSATLNAPYDRIYAILTDYSHLTQLSPKILESTLVQAKQDTNIVRTVTKDCALFFCITMKNTQTMHDDHHGHITGTTLPEQSDFSQGHMNWTITKLNNTQTEISMKGDFAPAFFVPPMIGPLIIQQKVKEQAGISIQTIEDIAKTPIGAMQ